MRENRLVAATGVLLLAVAGCGGVQGEGGTSSSIIAPLLPSAAIDGPCGASVEFQLAYELPGMHEAEVICDRVYKVLDAVKMTLDLYLPPGTETSDRLPVVIFVHGNDGLSDPFRPIEEHWKRDGYTNGLVAAASGWAGIAFDYRGYRQSNLDALAGAQQDVIDLFAYVAAHAAELRVDPDRVCLWLSGGGGLPGAWAALEGPHRPTCVVTFSARLDGDPSGDRDPVALVNAAQPPFFVARSMPGSYGYDGSSRFVERATAQGASIVVADHPGGKHFEQTAEPEARRIIDAALEFIRTAFAGSG